MPDTSYGAIVALIAYCEAGLKAALDEQIGEVAVDRYTILKAATNMAASLTSEQCEAVMSTIILHDHPGSRRRIVHKLADNKLAEIITIDTGDENDRGD